MTHTIAGIHGRNLELQCSLYEHTIAEMLGVLLCYITYDISNARMKFGAAMLSSRAYDNS